MAGPLAVTVCPSASFGAVCGSLVPYVHASPALWLVTTAGSFCNGTTRFVLAIS